MNVDGNCRRCGQRLEEYDSLQQQLLQTQQQLNQQQNDTRYYYEQAQHAAQSEAAHQQREQELQQKDNQIQQLQQQLKQQQEQQQQQLQAHQQDAKRFQDQVQQLQRGEEGLRRVLQEKERTIAELSQVREESARHREEAESLRQQLAAREQADRDARKDTSRYTKAIREQDELLEKHRGEVARLRSEAKTLEQALSKSEAENKELASKLEELTVEYGAADSEAADLVAMNTHLKQRVDELEVQCAAQQQYEAEFDARVTKMLDERDKTLATAVQDKDKLNLKVQELQEEVGLLRRDGGIAPADAQEMLMQFREKELLIQDLEDHIEELEQRLVQVQQELSATKATATPKAPAKPPPAAPPVTGSSTPSAELVSQYEKRLADFKADAVKKDQRIIDVEKKLRVLAAEQGAEALLDANLELERQTADMRKQVTEAKRDLSQYLAEAAVIVYENDLLRSISNVPKEQLNQNLEKLKLKEKVTAAKAVAAQRHLEREVQELEEERVKLKTKMRELSELAAGKVSLLHDLQPEQMLQLEEIAASMKKGKLQLPVTDDTFNLKKAKEELEKKLAAKDKQVSEHVDKKVDELLKKTATAKELDTRVQALEKENASLKEINKSLQAGHTATLDKFQKDFAQTVSQQLERSAAAQAQQREALIAQVGQTQDQQVASMLRRVLDAQTQVQTEMQQAAAQAAQQAAAIAACAGPPPLASPCAAFPSQPTPHDKAVGPSIPPTPAANTSLLLGLGSIGGITPQNMANLQRSGIFLGPQPMPRYPGMPAASMSTLLQTGVQLPRPLSDTSEEAMSALYCQVVECLEELTRERELRKQLGEQVREFRDDYDRLVAEKEVLFTDYLRQRENWACQQRSLESKIRQNADELKDSRSQLAIQQEQCRKYRALEGLGDAKVWKKELDEAMARIAVLEHSESVMARKLESAIQDHALVKQAFDNLENDFCDREKFLKERLAKAMQWKKQCVKALREARRRHREMVQITDLEEAQRQLQVSRQRETDLARRQTALVLAASEKEDRLREMGDLQGHVVSLDNLVRETEQEFTVLRQRLQVHEPRFAVECGLFTRLAADLQQRLGYVGRWEAVERALAAMEPSNLCSGVVVPGAYAAGGADGHYPSVEMSLDEKLRQIDTNNDGWITLQEFRTFLADLGIQVSDTEVRSLADGFHVGLPPPAFSTSAPSLPTAAAPSIPVPAAPSVQDVSDAAALGKANVSVLAIVGRFRLFGLRPLEPRELFWAVVQFSMLNKKLDGPHMLKNFQVFSTQEGYLEALHIVRVFQQHGMAIEVLSSSSLRRVLSWLGADPRELDQVMPPDGHVPPTGDPREVELRGKLLKLRLVYHGFADCFEKGTARALQVLRPPDAEVAPAVDSAAAAAATAMGPTTVTPNSGTDASAVQRFVAEAREAAASRRCVVLEQEVRTRSRTVQELQRQVGELEDLIQQIEGEKYEERGRRMELQAKLDSMVSKAEVEPKLKKLEELKFEVERSRLALRQSKDMTRVCAAQAESYEQLVKRRQQEVRHLQETVRLLQSGNDVANTVGKLQYRLLLSQWEKTNAQRQLQFARDEAMQARRELLDNEDEGEKERVLWEEEKESMHHRIIVLRDASEKHKEQAMSSLPIEKARELRAKVEEIANRKTQLETKLFEVRRELHRGQADTAEVKLRWQQGQELIEDLKKVNSGDGTSEAPRQRLLELAKKLEQAKLLELRHKRDLDIEKLQTEKAQAELKMASAEVERLQGEVAQGDLKLTTEEERWRERILEVQQYALERGVIPEEKAGSLESKRTGTTRKVNKEALASMEELYEKLMDKESKLTEMQVKLDKADAEKDLLVNEERTKVRQLQLELNLMNEGEMGKLRQTLHAERNAEINEISAAARDTVNTLQSLLNDAEARNRDWEGKLAEFQEEKRQTTQKHLDEVNTLQQELSRLHQELIQVRHYEGGPVPQMSPLAATSVDLDESLISAAHEGDYMARLEEFRQRGLSQEAQIEQMQLDFREKMEHQRQEYVRQRQGIVSQMNKQREDFLQKLEEQRAEFEKQRDDFQIQFEAHYRGFAQDRDKQFRSIEEQMHVDFRSAEEQLHIALGKSNQELGHARELHARSQVEIQQHQNRHQELLQQHQEYVKQHDFALGTAHEETRRAREETRLVQEEMVRLREELAQERDRLAQERERFKESNMRRQQIHLKRALDKRNEELKMMRHEVESLKKEVEKLEDRQYREGKEFSNAKYSEGEMKRLVRKHEERYRALQETVAQLTAHIQRRKEQDDQAAISKADQEADREGRQQKLEQLLDEASVQLRDRAAAADRAEEEVVKLRRRAEAAEKALESERFVLQGEVQVAQEEAENARDDSRKAAEAAARRVAAMREQLDAAAEEKGQLAVQVRGLEAASAVLNSVSGKGPAPAHTAQEQASAEIHEELRQEKLLREELQQKVSELHQQLELAHVPRLADGVPDVLPGAAGKLPSGALPAAKRLSAPRVHGMMVPSPSVDELGADAAERGSPKLTPSTRPRSASPPDHGTRRRRLLAEAEARNEEMKAEAIKWQAKADRLEQEVDDLKLRLAATEGMGEADQLRNKMESLNQQNHKLVARNDDLHHQVQVLRQQLMGASQTSQNLAGEAQKGAAMNRELQQQLMNTSKELAIEREHETQLREQTLQENAGLRRENDELRRTLAAERTRSTSPPARSPADAMAIQDLQAKLQVAVQEKTEMQRLLAESTRAMQAHHPAAGGADAVALADMRVKLQMVMQEKEQLQRMLAERAQSFSPSTSADFASFVEMRAQIQQLAQERGTLHQENGRLKETIRAMSEEELALRRRIALSPAAPSASMANSDMSAAAAQQRGHMQAPNVSLEMETRRQLAEAQQKIAEMQKEKDQMKDDISLMRATAVDNPVEASSELDAAKRQIADLQEQLSDARQDRDQLRDDMQLLQATRVDRSVSPSQASEELRHLRAELQKLRTKVAEQEVQLEAAEELKPMRLEMPRLRTKVAEQQAEVELSKKKVEELQSFRADIEKSQQKSREQDMRIQEFQQKSREQDTRIQELEQERDQLRDDLQLVRAVASTTSSRDAHVQHDEEEQAPSGLPGRDLVRAHRKISELEADMRAIQKERDKLRDDLRLMKQVAQQPQQPQEPPPAPPPPSGQGSPSALQYNPRSRRTTVPAAGALPVQRDRDREVREVRQEVRSTRELRDKLYRVEIELEEAHRRLEVDARAALEREREVAARLGRELEDSARTIEGLRFDLRRARTAAGQGAWAQQDEEQLRTELHLKKMEDEIAVRRRSEVELSDKLLEREHELMELRFEREQVRSKTERMEHRIAELELVSGDGPASPQTGSTAFGPATAIAASSPAGRGAAAVKLARKERGLEHVVDGLERVVNQQKAENERLKRELESKSDRRQRAEVEKLRKRVKELEADIVGAASAAARKREMAGQGRPGSPASLAAAAATAAGDAASANREARQARRARTAVEEELEEKDRRIRLLEESLLQSSAHGPQRHGGGRLPGPLSGVATGEEAERHRQQLESLRAARGEDAKKLDEAQRALREAELSERRYVEVARENKRLRADLSALDDDGFWDEISSLQNRCSEGAQLARDCAEEMRRLHTIFPSARQAGDLLARLDRFADAASVLA